jgi:hypothetical protein
MIKSFLKTKHFFGIFAVCDERKRWNFSEKNSLIETNIDKEFSYKYIYFLSKYCTSLYLCVHLQSVSSVDLHFPIESEMKLKRYKLTLEFVINMLIRSVFLFIVFFMIISTVIIIIFTYLGSINFYYFSFGFINFEKALDSVPD